MPMYRRPILDQWYRHHDKGYRFQVIALNEDERDILVQHLDGDIEELSMSDWYALDIEPIARPDNRVDPKGFAVRNDIEYTDTHTAPDN